MFSFTAVLAFAALVAAQGPTIATPAAVVQCQPAQISFVATSTPVFISIIPGGQPSAAPLEDLGSKTSSPFTWNADIASGTQITFQIRDSTGAVAYSAPVTIQSSSDSSCLGGNASSSGAASGSASQTGSASASASSVASTVQATSSAVSVSSSVAEATSSVVASASSAVSSIISTATAPATTSHASSAASSTRSATATSATPSASSTPNSARSNMQVGFAGLIGLAAAAVMA